MARARHPLPFEMWGITTDVVTGKYVLTENGVTYYMTLENTRLLKQYFRSNGMENPSIEKWYNDLERITRKEIKVVGRAGNSEKDF